MARLTQSLQEDLLTILAFSKENGKIVANIVNPQTFEGDYRMIAERCIEYWRKNKEPPGVNLQTVFDDILEDKNNRRSGVIRSILVSMHQFYENGPNEKYILDKLNLHQRTHALKAAITEAAELLNYKQELAIDEVESIFAKIGNARHISFDPGVLMSNTTRLAESVRNAGKSEFITGIKEFDDAHITPVRKELMVFVAPSGRGKSWFLAHLVKQSYLLRKKVLYITLELSEDQVLQRCWREIFFIAKNKNDKFETSIVETNPDDKDGYIIETETLQPEFTFMSNELDEELHRRLVLYEKRMENILIKQFPTRALSINGLRGYLDNLEIVHKFVPDLLVIDYPKLMKIDSKNLRISLGETMEEIRGICVERNMAGVIPHQASKAGAQALRVKGIHMSEDFSIYQTADCVITYSSTEEEVARGFARLYVDKSRSERGNFGVLITQSYALGQFVVSSIPLPRFYNESKLGFVDDDDDDDGDNGDDGDDISPRDREFIEYED